MNSHEPWIRRSQRVFRMVSELHRMGLQKLRLMPFEYPLAYRVYVGPAAIFSSRNGANIALDLDPTYAAYSSASGNSYFEWTDSESDNARQLAEKFLVRFPTLASKGKGRDWAYAGWLAELLSVFETYPSRLPIVQAEWMSPSGDDLSAIPLRFYGSSESSDGGGEMTFPLPPKV
jgi:hypothetical protein